MHVRFVSDPFAYAVGEVAETMSHERTVESWQRGWLSRPVAKTTGNPRESGHSGIVTKIGLGGRS